MRESKIFNQDDTHIENDQSVIMKHPINSTIKRHFSEMKARIESVKYKRKKGHKINKRDENELKREIEMDEHIVPIEELANRLGTNIVTGLTKEEAERKLKENGKNVLTPPKPKSKFRVFMGFALSPFSIMLWLSSGLSFLSYGLDTSQRDNLILGIALIIVILLSAWFAYLQGAKSEKVMAGFSKMIPRKCYVIRSGEQMEIDASDLTLGDIVELKAGEKIPADLRIIEASSMKVDNSSLTGESDPIPRNPEMTDENPLETRNLAFYTSSVVMGTGKAMVIRTGDHTVIGRIAGLASNTVNAETPLTIEMNHFVWIVASFATLMAAIFFVVGLVRYSITTVIIFVVGVFVGNIPEGILISVSVCLTLAAKRMAAKNVLVKNLESVETLGSTSTICSDKTGTLTMNQMTVQHLWFNGIIQRADENVHGDEPIIDLNNPVCQILNNIACLCNNAIFEEEGKTRGDASESALIKYCQPKRDILEWRKASPKLVEIPFNSANKFQVSVHKMEGSEQHIVLLKGAPERVLSRCNFICTYDSETKEVVETPLDERWRSEYQEAYDALGGKGERVLGFCYSKLNPEKYNDHYEYNSDSENFPMQDLTFAGLISLIDPPRPTVPDAVRRCKEAGIKVVMVTGDHPITAKAIAKQVGIITEETREDVAKRLGINENDVDDSNIKAIVVHGNQLLDMNEEEIDEILHNHEQIVFARTSPQQKLLIVEGFQRRGEIVAVTGDGVNDSPALKKADIGVSMGITGSDVSKEAADMILLDDNFASIVKGVEEGRIIFDNLKKTIAYLLPVNIAELTPIFMYIFFAFPLPLSTILMLCVSIGTDMLPAISLSYERAETDIMRRRPRDPKVDRLVTIRLISFAYLQIGVIQALAGLFTYFVVLGHYGFSPKSLVGLAPLWEQKDSIIMFSDKNGVLLERNYDYRDRSLRYAQTAVFVTIVLNQVGTLLIAKTRILSLFQQGMRNYVLLIGLFEEIALVCILCYIPPVRFITRTLPITILFWLPALPFTLFIFAYDEIRKLIIRHKNWRISHFVEEYSYY